MRNHSPNIKSTHVSVIQVLGPVTIALSVTAGCVLSLLGAAQCHLFISQSASDVPFLPSLIYGAAQWFPWVPVVLLLWLALEQSPAFRRLSPRSLAMQTIYAASVAYLHLELLWLTQRLLVRLWPQLWSAGYKFLSPPSISRCIPEVLLYALLWFAGLTLLARREATNEALQGAVLRRNLAEAELLALQRQMEPHFLLNTMNAILGLLESGQTNEASQRLVNLSALTKDALSRGTVPLVSVQEEFDLVERYIEIQKVRFGDRLRVHLYADPQVLESRMPSFLLQPLVENAVTHGIRYNLERCVIEASCERAGERLLLRVTDNGPGPGTSRSIGNGIGLRNTTSRLELLFHDGYDLQLRQADGGGCEVTVLLPLETVMS